MVGIYFSGTGNSRYAVELFCKEYDEAAKAFSREDDDVIEAVRNICNYMIFLFVKSIYICKII